MVKNLDLNCCEKLRLIWTPSTPPLSYFEITWYPERYNYITKYSHCYICVEQSRCFMLHTRRHKSLPLVVLDMYIEIVTFINSFQWFRIRCFENILVPRNYLQCSSSPENLSKLLFVDLFYFVSGVIIFIFAATLFLPIRFQASYLGTPCTIARALPQSMMHLSSDFLFFSVNMFQIFKTVAKIPVEALCPVLPVGAHHAWNASWI